MKLSGPKLYFNPFFLSIKQEKMIDTRMMFQVLKYERNQIYPHF